MGKINLNDPFIDIDCPEFGHVMHAEKFMLGSFPDTTLVVPLKFSPDLSDSDARIAALAAKRYTNTAVASGDGAITQDLSVEIGGNDVQQRLTLFLSD